MKSIFTFVFLSILCIASAQNTFKTRLIPFGFNGTNYSARLVQTAQLNDGSLVSIGEIEGGSDSMWLVKTSAGGTVLASQRISTGSYDDGASIVKTSDGGFAITGIVNARACLLKFDADLSLQWQQVYDGGNNSLSRINHVLQTADGGYLMAGYITDASGKYAGSVIKADSQGAILFQKRYFSFSHSFITGISPTKDGNYAFTVEADGKDIFSVDTTFAGKMAPDGSLLWLRQFADSAEPDQVLVLNAVTGASDGSVVVTGYTQNAGPGDGMLMVKFDTDGNLTWSKVLKGTNSGSLAFTVLEDKDGGYLFGGFRDNFQKLFPYVVKTSSDGALVWKKRFDPDSERCTRFTSLMATSGGGFIANGDALYAREENEYILGGIIYKFNSSFDGCSDIAVSPGGTLTDFAASVQTVVLSEANTTLAADVVSTTVTDGKDTIEDVCLVLPVHLTSFTAALQGKSVAVNWTTANEVNTDYFVVERSADKRVFEVLQQVSAKGNSNVAQSYTINDLQPLPGTSYYRLKEVDKDGKTTYSSIVPVTVMSNGTIVISPNPVQNNIRVVVQSSVNSNLTLQVVDMKGNVLAAQTKAVVAGRNEISIPAASLARGVYVLKVTDSKTTQAIRFVKE